MDNRIKCILKLLFSGIFTFKLLLLQKLPATKLWKSNGNYKILPLNVNNIVSCIYLYFPGRMSEVDGEVLFQCPYDNTHMVRLKRMPYHLMLCRKVSILLLFCINIFCESLVFFIVFVV